MKRRPVVLASVLVTAAITVPMLAWYRAGMFNLDAQERQERAKGQQEAQTSAVTAAARTRLPSASNWSALYEACLEKLRRRKSAVDPGENHERAGALNRQRS